MADEDRPTGVDRGNRVADEDRSTGGDRRHHVPGGRRPDMKQAIAVRADLGMGTGKLAAQVAHASLKADDTAADATGREWRGGGAKKVVLRVDDETELLALADRAEREGLPYAVVRDAGHTELDPNTTTTLGVGPAPEAAVDAVTGELSLY